MKMIEIVEGFDRLGYEFVGWDHETLKNINESYKEGLAIMRIDSKSFPLSVAFNLAGETVIFSVSLAFENGESSESVNYTHVLGSERVEVRSNISEEDGCDKFTDLLTDAQEDLINKLHKDLKTITRSKNSMKFILDE